MRDEQVTGEQAVIDRLYARLDEVRERTSRDLRRAQSSETAGTPGARTEREALVRMYAERLAALDAAEHRLCFGRLDLDGGGVRYVGRLGLSDDEQQPILTDWRAPAAEPFYQATAADPCGVTRRRHILTRGRTVTSLEDDILRLDSVGEEVSEGSVRGGGALMAALAAKRTGRMHDIVGTIQAEQDRIIRAPLPGVLVVDGAPGCGKTVVGLHRAAYLLFTYRQRLARDGVLIVGPNPLFMRYISQVLPALGETSAVMMTLGQLVPGVDAVAEDSDAVAALKGDARMARVIAAAVRRRQRVPAGPRRLDVGGTVITLTPAMVVASMDRARASRKPHNVARRTFALSLLDRLAAALADARRVDVASRSDLLVDDLRESRDVRREVNLCWMPLTPEALVSGLWADPAALAECAPHLSAAEVALLQRPRGSAWTVADVPLLDEAAELLGIDDEEQRRDAAAEAAHRRAEADYARAVLEMTGTGAAMTAEHLVERYAADAGRMAVAERAAGDREWTYGHVVVDEAQELSPMAWRILMRRCPSRSMTVVGDLDQRGSSAGAGSWREVFAPHLSRRHLQSWRVETLTVNYRTPEPLMAAAASVLRAQGLDPRPVTSARDGEPPLLLRMARDADPDALVAAVRAELAQPAVGRLAVIVASHGWVDEALAAALGEQVLGRGTAALDRPAVVLTAHESKGLEFDSVVIVEPSDILAASPRGAADLYVAITRSTLRLVVLHARELPPGLRPAG